MSAAMADSGQEIVKRVPVPQFLAEIGVKFAHDPELNARLVMIPPEVRDRVNVIDPVTSLVQADPNWTPRISIAQLDPNANGGPHFYKQAGNKLAPTKQALEVLGKAAGILYTTTSRVPRAELDEGEIGYRAVVGVRRSDGTVEELSREKIWVGDAEKAEIEDAVTRAEEWKDNKPVRGSHKFGMPGDPEWNDEVKKRWLKELKDRSAKTESKAVLRAIRAALQIPHTFTAADAAKPFLVVGFNFTPDYNDADTKRALVAAGLNAQAALYGRNTLPAEAAPEAPALAALSAGERQQAPAASSSPRETAGVPGDTDPQDGNNEAAEAGYNQPQGTPDGDPIVQAAQDAAKLVPPAGQHAAAGRTLADILALGQQGMEWFRRFTGDPDLDPVFADALLAFTRVYLPDVYQAVADVGDIEF